ncbi:MAG: hypothetical protein K2X08_07320, partial [Chlamydiales bacterium]|nr:hypothetical protein [Chlamydiales bacterium]
PPFALELPSNEKELSEKRSGLFSDLSPTRPLEMLLEKMGQFAPETRPTAKDLCSMLANCSEETFFTGQ